MKDVLKGSWWLVTLGVSVMLFVMLLVVDFSTLSWSNDFSLLVYFMLFVEFFGEGRSMAQYNKKKMKGLARLVKLQIFLAFWGFVIYLVANMGLGIPAILVRLFLALIFGFAVVLDIVEVWILFKGKAGVPKSLKDLWKSANKRVDEFDPSTWRIARIFGSGDHKFSIAEVKKVLRDNKVPEAKVADVMELLSGEVTAQDVVEAMSEAKVTEAKFEAVKTALEAIAEAEEEDDSGDDTPPVAAVAETAFPHTQIVTALHNATVPNFTDIVTAFTGPATITQVIAVLKDKKVESGKIDAVVLELSLSAEADKLATPPPSGS